MNFCPDCGGRVRRRVPPGDSLRRAVCVDCGAVHYRNPAVVVGCIAEHDGRLLLVRRARSPRRGAWTFPVGFMERRETTLDAVRREVREESGAAVEPEALYSVFDLPHMSQLYVVFRGRLTDDRIAAGSECSEARLFAADEIPWRRLTYPVIGNILHRYLRERSADDFALYVGSVDGGSVVPLGTTPASTIPPRHARGASAT